MNIINVKLSENPYPVYVGKGIFGKLPEFIQKNNINKNVFFIADKKMYSKHKSAIDKFYLGISGKKYFSLMDASEENKAFKSLQRFYNEMLQNGFGRDTVVIAVGGGITGDIAGFAAATFARGIQFIQIPTTLLAMVDSSVGGKTGINFGHTKNIIGSFYQPKFVTVDTDFLKTLPEEEIICGLGEIVKYGLLIGDDFFEFLKKNMQKLLKAESKLLTKVIEECIKFKARIVEKDEKEESGLRKVLNLGHTFAHAVEVEQKHKIKHGQAVIIGLACALHLSNKIGLLNDVMLAKYLSLVVLFEDKIKLEKIDILKCFEIMKRDKKNKDEIIKFVLLSSAGNLAVDVEAEKEDVFYAMNNGFQYFIN
jgi:3-dehydroquinate synthase